MANAEQATFLAFVRIRLSPACLVRICVQTWTRLYIKNLRRCSHFCKTTLVTPHKLRACSELSSDVKNWFLLGPARYAPGLLKTQVLQIVPCSRAAPLYLVSSSK